MLQLELKIQIWFIDILNLRCLLDISMKIFKKLWKSLEFIA